MFPDSQIFLSIDKFLPQPINPWFSHAQEEQLTKGHRIINNNDDLINRAILLIAENPRNQERDVFVQYSVSSEEQEHIDRKLSCNEACLY